jgi:hypothetical protein
MTKIGIIARIVKWKNCENPTVAKNVYDPTTFMGDTGKKHD